MNQCLESYRVLDLTEGGCMLCGRALADLGADVIKVEPLGGSPSRSIPPFLHNVVHAERSLFFFAYNANKRSITLNIESADGQELLKSLVKSVDFLLESFPAGYMDKLGLSYEVLRQINPRIIVVSITPFGQTGPKVDYRMSELTNLASSGALYLTGDPDRPPVWLGQLNHSELGAAQEACVGALVASWHRESTGEGQHVDVSIQACTLELLQTPPESFDLTGHVFTRVGGKWIIGGRGIGRETVFPCKDGYVSFTVFGGGITESRSSKAIVNWMAEDGMAPEWLQQLDWPNDYDASKVTQETVDRVEAVFARFLLTKAKAELFERSFREGVILAPVTSTKDIREHPQLEARDFWQQVEHPELDGAIIHYPGPFLKLSETPMTVRRRPPLIGEHNEEVYLNELGLSASELAALRTAEII
ncbi:MAG: CoA transferase [Chloroflexota bacterium]|nr:MAG: CoA transferase [Chloroflexota bacterium]